jgi:hypothetical protein
MCDFKTRLIDKDEFFCYFRGDYGPVRLMVRSVLWTIINEL